MLIASVLLLFLLVVLYLSIGIYGVPLGKTFKILLSGIFPIKADWDISQYNVIMKIRLPRLLGALFVGASLSVASCAYQSIFNNPLVSSDLLGVSAGASVGAGVAILIGASSFAIFSFSFITGVITVLVTVLIPTAFKNRSNISLVLSGIIVGGFMSSLLSLLKYVADPETTLADLTYWLLGSVARIEKELLWVVVPVMSLSIVALILMSWRINLLSLGDKEARHLGARVGLEKTVIIILSTVLTASSVAISGTISWLGLIIPHLARFIVGADNRKLIPISCTLGASFLVIIDLLSRTISKADIPLGILIGLVSAPFFAVILVKQRRA